MRRWLPVILVVVLMVALASVAHACPFCKDSIPNSDAQQAGGVPSGFNNTIYVMLVGMVAVLGMITFTLVKGARSTNVVPRDIDPRRGFPLQ